MSVFLRSGCQDKDGRPLASGGAGGPVGILGPTRRPLQMHTTRTLARRGVVGVVPAPARPPSGDGITLNSNVFTVCSASISPDPPEEPAPLPRRPVVLASTPLRKRAADSQSEPLKASVLPSRRIQGPHEDAAGASQSGAASRKDRIPRPPNAFMLFANEFRKKLSCENPRESNKDISVRLGTMWKLMPKEKKDTYFELARLVDAEHKKKYPDYVYNPKEARLRKAMRDQVRCRSQGVRTPGAAAGGGGGAGAAAAASGVASASARAPQSPHSPASPMKKKVLMSPRRMSEQQSHAQQRLGHSAVREQVEAGMLQSYDDAFVDLGYQGQHHHHQHQQQQQQHQQQMHGWYPVHVQAADSSSALRQWTNADCLVPSPHVSPFGGMPSGMSNGMTNGMTNGMANGMTNGMVNGMTNGMVNGMANGMTNGMANGRMPLMNGGGDADEELKLKVENTSQDCQAFSLFSNKDSAVPEERPDSLGLEESALDSALAAAPAPTRLPGFQETFCSNEAGVSRGFDGFYSSADLELQVQTPPHPQLLGDSLLAPPDWPPLLFLSPGSEVSPYPTGYSVGYPDRTRKTLGYEPPLDHGHEVDHNLSHAMDHGVEYATDYPMWAHRIVYPPEPCSPPYSPFGFCDYSVLDMMPLARPVAAAAEELTDPLQECPPPGPAPGPAPQAPAYTDLTELHPYMQHIPYRAPLGSLASPPDLVDMEALIKQEDFGGQETDHQAALRRMVYSEPVIIQENERICVVRESGPARTFTAM